MYTQLFGGYLLNHGILTVDQLSAAMDQAKETRVKLGVLAINAGYMTAEQVDKCHQLQLRLDKRMGDIAVEQGFMTDEQVTELLKSQKCGYLVLGQAIMDKGFLDNAAFEKALSDYKHSATITESDFLAENEQKAEKVLADYYGIGAEDASKGVSQYISLLMKNFVRFIGDDFSLLKPEKVENVPADMTVFQTISGKVHMSTAICMDKGAFLEIASRYAKEKITEIDEFAEASVGEFLNLHNGLFTVNMSEQQNIELELAPQNVKKGGMKGTYDDYVIPVQFPFGAVRFVISCK